VDRATRLAVVGIVLTIFAFGHRFWQAFVVAVLVLAVLEVAPRLRAVADRVSRLSKSRDGPKVVAHPIPAHAMGGASPASVDLGWAPNLVSANGVAGRFTYQLRRPITATPVLNLPPQRTGPWRPGGHGPDPVGGSTCVCGATGITDWPAHIAEAATA
jgi:hypothetical protein